MPEFDFREGLWGGQEFEVRESEFLEDPEEDIHSILAARCEAIAERQEAYDDFLRSSYWQSVKAQVRRRAQGKCEGCGRYSNRLEVHHKWYPKRGTEHLNLHALECLCSDCHRDSHF